MFTVKGPVQIGLAATLLAISSVDVIAQQGVTATEILIGEIAPLTGPAAVGSLGLSAGNKLAIAEANATGGINGRKLRLISEDDGYVVARTARVDVIPDGSCAALLIGATSWTITPDGQLRDAQLARLIPALHDVTA